MFHFFSIMYCLLKSGFFYGLFFVSISLKLLIMTCVWLEKRQDETQEMQKVEKAIVFYFQGKPVWFDSGAGYPIAGEVVDVTRTRISIKSLLNGKIFVFATDETNRVVSRIPLPPEGVNDMITMSDLSEASILWNIKVRYDHRQFYVGIKKNIFDSFFFLRNSQTYIGSILVAVNPYHMYHDMYSTNYVRKYENALVLNALPAQVSIVYFILSLSMIFTHVLDIFLLLHHQHIVKCWQIK